MLHVNKNIPVTFEISGPCNCEYYTFWLCSKADGGYISVKTSSWFGTINKLLHLDWMYCTSDQNTEKHQQSWTQWSSTPSVWQENWQVQEREHFLFSKTAKKQTDRQTSKQPSNESRQQEPSPIIPHRKQSSYDPLMQAYSAIFCCYHQKSLPCDKKRNGSWNDGLFTFHPPDMPGSPRELNCFYFTVCFWCLISTCIPITLY